MSPEQVRDIWIIAISVALVIGYVIYVCMSFFFMNQFKKKIETSRQGINVLIFQKFQSLYLLSNKLIELGYDNPRLIEFISNGEFKEYKKLEAKEFEEKFNISESYFNLVKGVCANLKHTDDLTTIRTLLKSLDGVNSKYFESIQLYNTYIVGYNYWRNLFFTKWIKVLFKKDTLDTIK